MAALDVNIRFHIMFIKFIVVFICLILSCHGRIHNLKLQNDNRHQVTLGTFGFLRGGTLAVNITLFSYKKNEKSTINNPMFGFTLDKSNSVGFSKYVESSVDCILVEKTTNLDSVFFKFDLKNKRINIERNGDDLKSIKITDELREQYLFDNHMDHGVNLADLKEAAEAEEDEKKMKVTEPAASENKSENKEKEKVTKSRQVRAADDEQPPRPTKTNIKPPIQGKKLITPSKTATLKEVKTESSIIRNFITSIPMKKSNLGMYQAYFLMHVRTLEEEGIYTLFFHNCLHDDSLINLTLQIIEDNNGNYLSADEMPIPAFYFVFCVVFFILCCIWMSVLRQADEGVCKIHYLMCVVVFFKSISCLFHGINMYMIQKNGIHIEALAILWYIVYLTSEILIFVTVLLIGAGWSLIKHSFTDREKKLILIFIPIQIFETIVWVIVEESEEGSSSYNTWHYTFLFVDLLSCLAVLLPVLWSRRRFKEACKTDQKAAVNLKLFKFFFTLVVCYLYFSRIVFYLLKFTLPFPNGWIATLFTELVVLCFFTLTGFKFRPTSNNPYLQVPQDLDGEDIQIEEVMTKTGNTESVTRVNQN